jgi:hypothetical protein
MKRVLLALSLILAAVVAVAQPAFTPLKLLTGPVDTGVLTGALNSLILQINQLGLSVNYGTPVYNVMAFGAKCDATSAVGSTGTDDTVPINAAAAALRAHGFGMLYSPPERYCYHTGTINLTNFSPSSGGQPKTPRVQIAIHLMCAVGTTPGPTGTCVDAIGSKYVKWTDFELFTPNREAALTTVGDDALIGLQIGRPNPTQTASQMDFFSPRIDGRFSQVAVANYASEATQVFGGVINNESLTAGSSNIWIDCDNHHNVLASAFTTISWPSGTFGSCDEAFNLHGTSTQKGPGTALIATAQGSGSTLTFAAVPSSIQAGYILKDSASGNGLALPTNTKVVSTTATTIVTNQADVSAVLLGDAISVSSPDPAVWTDGTSHWTCNDGGYISTKSQYAITMFEEGAQPENNPEITCHIESFPNLVGDVLISGTVANPAIYGFVRHDHFDEAAFAVAVPDFANGVLSFEYDQLDFMLKRAGGNPNFKDFGLYQSLDITTNTSGALVNPPTVATPGSGCTPGAGTQFTIVGGEGIAGIVVGTVGGGGTLSGALTLVSTSASAASTGSYLVTPGPVASTTGGGCSVQPTINLFYINRTVQLPIKFASGIERVNNNAIESVPASANGLLRVDGSGAGATTRLLGNLVTEPNLPSAGGVPVCIDNQNQNKRCTNIVGQNLLLNGGFDLDQKNEGASATIDATGVVVTESADGWNSQGPTAASNLSIQRVATVQSGAPFSLKLTVGTGSATVNATDVLSVYQALTGADIAQLEWGTSTAFPVVVSGSINCSVAGAYGLSINSGASDLYYATMISVPTANTDTTFTTGQIPGPTTGTWYTSPGDSDLYISINYEVGSTFQGTTGAWTATKTFSDSSQTQLSTTTGGHCSLTKMKMEQSTVATQYLAEEPNKLLQRAQRRYFKTFPPGVAPAQSAGVAGALCTKNPIANGDPSLFWQWPTPMIGIVAPTVTTYNPSAANANWRNVTAGADATVSKDPASALSESTGVLLATSGTVASLGDILCIHAVADAALK